MERTMDTERWRQVKEVLYEAMERALPERRTFLDQVCAGDPALREKVEALLQAHAQADDFLVGPPTVMKDFPEAFGEGDGATGGRQVGSYRLLHLLGRGGMGEVYLAERADGLFERRVAVKLVKHFGSDVVQRRFDAERRILAGLQHENIARLLDGGTTDDGRPYFAMEYVQGQPLTTYAAARNLGLEARLKLLIDVGQAVHHAHRNLVVHRDLKPSNVLVNDEGEVKLLDFGIAKLLQDEGGEARHSVLTETGVRPMTRAYAAPEQIRGEPVTTATDVYTLGVLLYELLTGRRPFEAPTPHALEQAILDTDPEPPSSAARRVPAAETEASVTDPGPAVWTKKLHGDLDVVCLKALRKDPTERYASAEAFVADVKRFLAGLPVDARPPTRGYRLRKFVQRNRVGVAAASLFFLLMLAFGVAMAVQNARVAAERDRAERELAKAQTVTGFMTDLFDASRPSEARGDTVTARELLERGRARLEALVEQPEVHAQTMELMGNIYKSLGEYEAAAPLLEQALATRRRHLGAVHADVATSLYNLARLREDEGRYEEALALSREALDQRRSLFGEAHPAIAQVLRQQATLQKHLGHYDEATRRFRELLALERRLYGADDLRIAGTLNNFGRLLDSMFEYEASQKNYREALAIYQQHYPPDHPDVIYTRSNIGWALYRTERYDEAVEELEQVVALRRRVLGEEHPGLATSLSGLGTALMAQGNIAAAVTHFDEAERIYRAAFGDDHPNVATVLYNRARVHHKGENWRAAEADYRLALQKRRAVLGEDHPRVALIVMYLGRLQHDQQDHVTAEKHYLDAMTILDRHHGAGNRGSSIIHEWLVELYEATGRPEAAARYASQQTAAEG